LAELSTWPVATHLAPGELLRAVAAEPTLDTAHLVCLAGRWAGNGAVIAWNPQQVQIDAGPSLLDELPTVTGQEPAIGGGWFGWFAFDRPGSWFGRFDTVLRQDAAGRWWLESVAEQPDLSTMAQIIESALPPPADAVTISRLTVTERDTHLAAVERAISAIRAGALYQVNICARLHGRLTGGPPSLFARGLSALHPDYAAYLHTPDRTVISFSPELFLHRVGREVRTEPIKGTRRRTVDGPDHDDPAAVELRASTKDRAENVMIVDLMRNDLSRVCVPGSVITPELLSIRPAPGVWHLVSEVTGTLQDGAGDTDLITATFPPGSVTGAPKIRALALIDELEGEQRQLFTGAIGYSAATDTAEFNVAIRTFEVTGEEFELGVGGGITADSVPVQEWQECLIKAEPLLQLAGAPSVLETSRWPDVVDIDEGIFDALIAVDGEPVGLRDHLSRLESSCLEVFGRRLADDLAAQLIDAVKQTTGRQRVRVVVRPDDAEPSITVAAAPAVVGGLRLVSTAGRTGCWRHKWNDRRYLAAHETGVSLPLFTKGNLALETSRSNIAIVTRDGVIATPPLTDDVLPGVTRRRFLDAAGDRGWPIELRRIEVAELGLAALVLSLNASGIVEVASLDGRQLGIDARLLDEFVGWGC
jgi:para-aminobenzoate synthetase/4-amino-4-deoxychorismate lyase